MNLVFSPNIETFCNDIEILQKIYKEYKEQDNKTIIQYNNLIKKYKNNFESKRLRESNAGRTMCIILGKFYKYNFKTNKISIPIFVGRDGLYTYKEYEILDGFTTDHNPSIGMNMFTALSRPEYDLHYIYDPYDYKCHKIQEDSNLYRIYNFNNIYNRYKLLNETKTDFLDRNIYNTDNNKDIKKLLERYEFEFIPFKTKSERKTESTINNLELKINNLELSNNNLIILNKELNSKIRNIELEVYYLKSINKETKIKYNYQEIKNRNKKLNSEFKRVAKLMKLNK